MKHDRKSKNIAIGGSRNTILWDMFRLLWIKRCLKVGTVTNMYTIVETMNNSSKTISI